MKSYPSIPKYTEISNKILKDRKWFVFSKEDGSNIRAEWSKKSGFHKFGSRRVLIGETTPILGESISLIRDKEEVFSKILMDNRIERCVLFFEFWGENSFAGNHADEEHVITLLDIDVFKKGILPPADFLKLFEDKIEIPKLLHHGKINSELIESVIDGTLDGMTFEGVVCKAKNPKKTLSPVMFKIKNKAWLDKLKNFCGDDAEMFRRLA